MKKELRLSSVKLKNKGLSGVEVTYAQTKIKGNRSFLNEIKEKSKQPIHTELEKCFSWLKPDMLKICGYNHEDQSLLSALEMTEVNYSDKGFVLVGDLSVWAGIVPLKTPLIEDGNQHDNFGGVCAILDGIYTETKEYMAGNKTMDDTELVLRFNSGKEDFDAEAFKAMPKEEREALATKILEDAGCIVLQNDDFEEDLIETKGLKGSFEIPAKTTNDGITKEELLNVISIENSGTITTDKSLPASPTATTTATIVQEGDDFSIILPEEPVKVSTAKRKA